MTRVRREGRIHSISAVASPPPAMESSQIVKARARAAELQAKIDASLQRVYHDDEGRHGSLHSFPHSQNLRAVQTALLHLQDQLDSLQALQKRQKFEKEDLLVELEERRNLLIKRLREYKGTEWEIVEEAHAFVGEPVQREDDLMLPPYQPSTRDAHTLREGCGSNSLSRPQESKTEDELKQSQACNVMRPSRFLSGLSKLASRAGKVVLLSAKSVVVVASIMFTLSQLEPPLKKWSSERVINTGFRIYGSANRRSRPSSSLMPNSFVIEDKICPPSKVLLVQDGIHKCIAKERTEAPFKAVSRQPDATYGCG